MACGACHNNINWVTGANHPGVGGARADDSQCKTCHTATAIATVYHISVDPTGSEGRGGYPVNTADNVPTPGYPSGQGPAIPLASSTNPPAGVPKVAFEIKSVSVAAQKATFVYRILFDGTPVTFLPAGDKYLLANVDGTPQLSVTYGLIEDGVTTVADWTAAKTVTVKQCRDQVANTCTQTGPDASGWYTATFQSAQLLPADAQLVTGVLGLNYQAFVKLDHPDYPKGIRLREPAFAMLTATGHTARRTIVEAARCNMCHNQLGVEPSFHSGARNNGGGLRHRRLPLRDPVDRAHRRSQQLRRRLGAVVEEHDPRHPRRVEADAVLQLRGDGEEPEGLRHRHATRACSTTASSATFRAATTSRSRRMPTRRRTSCGRRMPTATCATR